MENPIKMDDLGVPPFSEASIWYFERFLPIIQRCKCSDINQYAFIMEIHNQWYWLPWIVEVSPTHEAQKILGFTARTLHEGQIALGSLWYLCLSLGKNLRKWCRRKLIPRHSRPNYQAWIIIVCFGDLHAATHAWPQVACRMFPCRKTWVWDTIVILFRIQQGISSDTSRLHSKPALCLSWHLHGGSVIAA